MWGYSFEEMAKIASEEAAKLAVSNIIFSSLINAS